MDPLASHNQAPLKYDRCEYSKIRQKYKKYRSFCPLSPISLKKGVRTYKDC
uniref:Candidate secreted effector n=1 Tax=Meloidogyne incognita TaxID=6306 RepID=A0A914KTX5_MELIC